jgi:MoaA/NifB/PqqE/SkfB family radical SAM enzyme
MPNTQVCERLDFIWLELTGRCNLECVHCYADSHPGLPLDDGMREEDWVGALDEAAALDCRRVQFIGGEPTLHPALPRLIAHARRAGYREVAVFTNGTRFTDALKSVFVEHHVSLAFSIYGSSGAVHDRVTLRSGSFDRTAAAMRWALEAGLPVRAGVISMEENAEDAELVRRLLRDAGIPVHLDHLRGMGRGSASRPAASPLKELCGRCGNGKVCVSVTGEIYPCVFARFAPLGHARREGLAAAFSGAGLRGFREALFEALPNAPAGGHDVLPQGATCSPEEPAGPCNPETPPGPCNPETPPGPCSPEIPPPDCTPEQPSCAVCGPETTAHAKGTFPLRFRQPRP